MSRDLPTDDSGTEYIQFRGYQSPARVERVGLSFRTEIKETPDGVANIHYHIPKKVITREEYDDAETDTPDEFVLDALAQDLVDGDGRNPLISYGVCCEWIHNDGELCGDVFDTPRGLNAHLNSHYDVDEESGDATATDTEEPDNETEDADEST